MGALINMSVTTVITLYYLKRSVLNTTVGDSQRNKKVWPILRSLKYHTVETVPEKVQRAGPVDRDKQT